MAVVLDLLLSKTLSSEELLQWLTDPQYEPSLPDLKLLRSQRKDFVEAFINFIRDQCPLIQQASSQARPQQPNAAPSRVANCGTARTAKLESALSVKSPPTVVGRRQCTVRVGDCDKSALPAASAKCDTSRASGVDISAFKSTTSHRNEKRTVFKDRSTPATLGVAARAPDIADCAAFPAVNEAVESTRPIRRITPTPVKSNWRKLTLKDFLPPEVSHECQRKEGCRPRHGQKESKESTRNQFKRTDALQLRLSAAPQSCSSAQRRDKKHRTTAPAVVSADTNIHSTEEVQADSYIVPAPDCITEREKLDDVAAVYAALLNKGLVVNLTIELFFLLKLLTVKEEPRLSEEPHSTKLLESVHNCIYFAAAVLQGILQWLCFLDKPTLKLLSNVQHIATFAPQLYSSIVSLVDCVEPLSRFWSSSIQGVAFDSTTDSRKHFASENNFRAFRKQRDLFYNLFRDWQRHQFCSGEKFSAQFPHRVAEILDTCSDPCNLSHLARLVLGQLMTSCCGTLELDDQGNFDEKFLHDLKSTSPEKMEKLEERFLLPFKVGGPCPSPSFTGSQIFFYEFIKAATNSIFLQHFKDQCVSKIVELEKDNPFQDAQQSPSEELKRALIAAVYKSKLLGLFLGVVEFLPYSTIESFPKQYIDQQQTVRNLKPLPLNVTGLIKESVKSKQLAATLTWVVNFLSMMDPIAKTLIAYRDVLWLLFSIYKSPALLQASSAAFFARVLLGWLFEVQSIQSDVLAYAPNDILGQAESLGSFVDGCIIYMCCPYLGELRCILLEHLTGTKTKYGEFRKITPISASESDLKAQLKNQLEENFFHIHPVSVKKTVEFVADRVSSNVAKCLKKDVQAGIAHSRDIISHMNWAEIEKEERQLTIMKLFQQISEKAEKTALEQCKELIEKLLPVLLPPDMQGQAVKMCCYLSTKSAVSKVRQWLKTNVTEKAFRQGISAAPHQANSDQNTSEDKDVSSHYHAASAFNILDRLQDCMRQLQSGRGCTCEDAVKLLELCAESLHSSQEWFPFATTALEQATFDFVLCLAVWCPQACTRDVFDVAVPMWECSHAVKKACKMLYCARNLHLAVTSADTRCTLLKFGELAQVLLYFGLLTVADLEESLKKVLDFELPSLLLELTVCVLSSVLELYKNSNENLSERPD
ncbi:codanin-1 like protein dlt [Amblyomma americanum]